jgi:transposase
MPKRLTLRELTAEERPEVERPARSRTEAARLVQRARITLGLAGGERPSRVAAEVGVGRVAVYDWMKRFNAGGVAGLTDRPRSGRPPTYTAGQRAEVAAAALTEPDALGLPFGSWPPDRLAAYLAEHTNVPIRRSRIDEVLVAEGPRWRKRETWFGEKVDPEVAAKRGRSNGSTPPRPKGRRSSASTRWGRTGPRASRAPR